MFEFYPEKTYSRTEVMSKPTPVPAVNGVYFWCSRKSPRAYRQIIALPVMATHCCTSGFRQISVGNRIVAQI